MNRLNIREVIRTLPPGYFALPMSTGIISIATYLLGFNRVSNFLFILNTVELVTLSALLLLRISLYFPEFKKDLSTHSKGAAYLTTVAALCILGTKNVLVRNDLSYALLGWSVTFGIWLTFIFSFFILIILKKEKVGLREGINGTWLLMVVSSQALSISGNLVHDHFHFQPQITLFITLALYLLGAIFYIILISIIFYRMAFLPMEPKEFHPSFWINMGAAAISTLAGAVLVESISGVGEFQSLIPVLKVFTVFFWIAGSWWIPVIVVLEIWKRLEIRVRYTADYWSLVFPLGVYTVCTFKMAEVMGLEVLKTISGVTIYFALVAWLVTYFKMVESFWRKPTGN